MDVDEKLRQGIRAAKAGQRAEAQQLLLEVVQIDETQLKGWMWLSYVVDTLADKEICFENMLALAPGNEFAQKGLIWLANQSQKDQPAALTGIAPTEVIEAAKPLVNEDKTDTTEILSREAAVAGGFLYEDEFDNEWLCPYCTAQTTAADRMCPACRRPLVLRQRERETRSVWLWRGIYLQLGTASYIVMGALAYVMIMGRLKHVPNPLIFWPTYLGVPIEGGAEQAAIVQSILPPTFFWLLIGAVFYILGQVVVLYLRVPYGHLLYMLNAGVTFMLAIIILLPGNPVGAQWLGAIALVLGGLQVIITTNLWPDFTFNEKRLRLHVDRSARTADAFYLTGRNYARDGEWGNAVIHLRRAVSLSPLNLDYHLALTVAYLQIKRADLAHNSLAEATKLDPKAPQVKKLQQRLAAMAEPSKPIF